MLNFAVFAGGDLETNGYYLLDSKILIDAPEGICDWLLAQGYDVSELWLTHGHFDHIMDAGKIVEKFNCPVSAHSDDLAMMDGRVNWRLFGVEKTVPILKNVRLIKDGDSLKASSSNVSTIHVPGHSPGSVCFFFGSEGDLFGGDVLFCGGVGRWDLPGGNRELLLNGIKKHILTLPNSTRVHPGHGPSTEVGREAAENPFLI